MNKEELREQLKIDEGVRYEIYRDHLGHLTFGIGHLVTSQDREYGLGIGYPISKQRVNEAFDEDIEDTLDDCKRLYDDFDVLPEEVQQILANMMFNLGYGNLSRFRKMNEAIKNRDWQEAADQMVSSRWYGQVGNRSKRLVARMRKVG